MNWKQKSILCFLSCIFLCTNSVFSQDNVQRRRITSSYDKEELRSRENRHRKNFRLQKTSSERYLQTNSIRRIILKEDGRISQFVRIDEKGNFIYLISYDNKDAGITIGVDKLYNGGSLGLDLSGKGFTVGLWDAGKVRGTHELLTGKVTQMDKARTEDDHSTQVAGTLVGKKLDSNIGSRAQGIAYEAFLDAYDWEDDMEEMYDAATEGLLVSNHSYGPDLAMVANPLNLIGSYDQISAAVDNLMEKAPYYTIVNAAGNDRDSYNLYNPNDGGYNLLAGEMSTAKNVIVVAAVYPIAAYTNASSIRISEYSSWGPTNDNRVKPDISADGMFVLSSVSRNINGRPSNNLYDYYSGTSAAAPSVAAGILLLQELSTKMNHGEFLKNSSIRAIIAGTARDAGEHPGPDPIFGWGLLNLEGAAKLMLENANPNGDFYEELQLRDKDSYSKKIEATSDTVKVTMAWTDPSGEPQKRNQAHSILVNDLDMRLVAKNGQNFYPWRLNPNSYDQPALNDGDNAVDNIEQILIADAVPGEEYEIKINHKGNLKNGIQDFTLVVQGAEAVTDKKLEDKVFVVFPNPTSDYVILGFEEAYDEFQVAIFDLLGREVLHKKVQGKPVFQYQLDVAQLASGNYFLHIQTPNKKHTEQLIVY